MRHVTIVIIALMFCTNVRADRAATQKSQRSEEEQRRERIMSSHGLKAGEIVKRIMPADFSDARTRYLQLFSSGIDPETLGLVMQWDGQLKFWTLGRSATTVGMLRNLGLKSWQFRLPPELSGRTIPGDWTIRAGAPMEKKIAAFVEIVKKDLEQNVVAELKQVEMDGLVVEGKFVDHGTIHLAVGKPDPFIKPTKDSGTLREFLETLGDVGMMPLVDQTTPSHEQLKWEKDVSFYSAGENPQKMDRFLETVTDQTDLTFTREKQKVPVWVFRIDSESK